MRPPDRVDISSELLQKCGMKTFFSFQKTVFFIFAYPCVILLSLTAACRGGANENILWLLEKAGMQERIEAPVGLSTLDNGLLLIQDTGLFLVEHLLADRPAAEPNVIVRDGFAIRPQADKLVIVTHGWLDKGEDKWPAAMAGAIAGRVDPNEWICGVYDWKGGSVVMLSTQAAEYSRDIAGPRLAAAVLKIPNRFTHIHLIGHSAGAWILRSAAKELMRALPDTVFHLTFLDAYVPSRWNTRELCDWTSLHGAVWAEHYYTRDFTLNMTEQDLPCAHNVDITALDPWVAEHEFPYRWYLATITGRYERWDEKALKVFTQCGNTEYGFARSLESGEENWRYSRLLPCGDSAVLIQPGQ